MADATLASAPAETRVVTWPDGWVIAEPADVLVDYFGRKPQALQNLLRRNQQGFMTAVVDPLRDNLETRRKMTQFRLEAALRDRHSDRGKIQGLHDRLEVMEKLLKIKPEADPPRPSRSAEARGDKNFHLEVRDVLASRSTQDWVYYQRHRDKILAKRHAARTSGRYYYYKPQKCPEKNAKAKMKRILEALQERGSAASLDLSLIHI